MSFVHGELRVYLPQAGQRQGERNTNGSDKAGKGFRENLAVASCQRKGNVVRCEGSNKEPARAKANLAGPDFRIYGILLVVASFLLTQFNPLVGSVLAILGLILIIIGFVGHSRLRSKSGT